MLERRHGVMPRFDEDNYVRCISCQTFIHDGGQKFPRCRECEQDDGYEEWKQAREDMLCGLREDWKDDT